MSKTLRGEPVFTPLELSQEQADDGLIRGVLLCGNASKNGYAIPPEAFGSPERVKQLYEGLPVYFDHVDKRSHPFNRESGDAAGVVRNVQFKSGRPYGDIETLDSDKGRHLRSLIKASPRHYGLSHIAKYDLDKRNKRVRLVEEVFSVDVVINPATTHTFYESQKGEMDEEFFKEQIAELKGEKQSLNSEIATLRADVEKLKAENKELDTKVVTLKAEKTDLETKVAEFGQEKARAERRALALEKCEAAGLDVEDKEIVSERFIASLVGAADDEEMDGLIDDRAAIAGRRKAAGTSREQASEPRVRYQERRAPSEKPFDPNAFLSDLKVIA